MATEVAAASVARSQSAPPEPTLWQRVMDAAKDMARPVVIYSNGLACAVSVFVPSVTADKMMVLAAVSGAVGWMHGDTKTKLAQIQANASNGDGDGK